MRIKGISVCFIILKAALCGSYVNFGVFKLYGDDTLENVLNIIAKLILSIQQSVLLVSSCNSDIYFFKSGNYVHLFLFFKGVSEVVTVVLFVVGMFGPRSYVVFVYIGAEFIFVYYGEHIGGIDIGW